MAVVVLATTSGALAACSEELPPSGTPTRPPTVSASPSELDVPGDALVLVQGDDEPGAGTLRQRGSADATVSVQTVDDGEVRVIDEDGRPALRFPTFTASTTYPRAVVTVVNARSTDALNPGTGDFSYGVDFHLDDVSTGRAEDNGNNLIQRGLSSEPTLYKLEVDASLRPSCSVRGSAGEVTVRSNVTVVPGVWYRARCNRSGDRVEVSIAPVFSNGTSSAVAREKDGPIGVVAFAQASIPVSIGGKVATDGRPIASATDQFNGLMRNPFIAFGD